MHELSLYGSVPAEHHGRLLQQLAGVTCMQPQNVEELHLVFKSRIPPGLSKVQETGGSQDVRQQQADVQRLKTMLQAGIYFVQLVGSVIRPHRQESLQNHTADHTNNINGGDKHHGPTIEWTLEFKDTPESGKQATNSRFISRTKLQDGEMISFMDFFGFDYVNRYYVQGQRFYHQDTSFFLHRIRRLPTSDPHDSVGLIKLPPLSEMSLLDPSGNYILQATIDIVDGNVQEPKERAIRQLLSMRETMKEAVALAPADRLAMDTRIPVSLRR